MKFEKKLKIFVILTTNFKQLRERNFGRMCKIFRLFRTFLAFTLILLLIFNCDASTDSEKITMVEISSLDNHCEKNVCRDYHFDNVQEVAFFDPKTQVKINSDGEDPFTYDLSSGTEYESLIFENSTFAHFPLHFFYSMWVKELDMRHCGIQRLTWENFLMAADLRILQLSENELEQIDEMTFNYATELQYLFLDSNRLQRLVSESFKGLTQLKFLELHNNSLESLPLGVFDYFPNLQELNIAQNRLSSLHVDLFTQIPNLLTLLMYQNDFAKLNMYLFLAQKSMILVDVSQNPRLKTFANILNARYLVAANCHLLCVNIFGKVQSIDLSNNYIFELYFSQPEQLESLNLRNNSLQQIASLTRATNLRSLILADNEDLVSLPDPWNVESLEYLDLSNTGLTELPIASLAPVGHHLRHLNISSNQISEINPRNFEYFENLTHFYIHANNWNCFNLNLLMDLLIKPHNILFTRDEFDADFPGEYIHGIACMYRLQDEDASSAQDENGTQAASGKYIILSESKSSDDALQETKNLRKELKAIVSFYEEKFSKAFEMITDLKRRLDRYEHMNDTVWQHITIST